MLVSPHHCRAFAKLHADRDRDRGTHSLHPLYTNRCSSPDASPAESELRRDHPFCSCVFQREPSGSSSASFSFFSFKGSGIYLFSGFVIITFPLPLSIFLGGGQFELTEGPSSTPHLKCTWLQVTMLVKDILSSKLPFNVNSEKSGL